MVAVQERCWRLTAGRSGPGADRWGIVASTARTEQRCNPSLPSPHTMGKLQTAPGADKFRIMGREKSNYRGHSFCLTSSDASFCRQAHLKLERPSLKGSLYLRRAPLVFPQTQNRHEGWAEPDSDEGRRA